MSTKIIIVCLILLYVTLCGCGSDKDKDKSKDDWELTEEQFNSFRGVDISKHCGKVDELNTICNMLGKRSKFTTGKIPQVKGYPTCLGLFIKLKSKCGVIYKKLVSVVVCSWDAKAGYLILGKGHQENHVMNYNVNSERYLTLWSDLLYAANKTCS